MTLRTYLAGLPANPLEPDSPPLYVAVGDLTPDEAAYVTSPEYGPHPYALLLDAGDAAVQRYDNGTARQLSPVDVVLEMRPPTDMAAMRALYDAVTAAPAHVTELLPGVPLAGRLVYAGGMRPQPRYQMSEWLTATVRFDTPWHSRW